MPGKWQIRILTALAQESPRTQKALQACCGATTPGARSACKRAVWTLMRQGLLVRVGHGRYRLVVDVSQLIRQHWPHTGAVPASPQEKGAR